MSEEIPKTKKEIQYTHEALTNSGLWKTDIVNAFLEKGKMYSIAQAKKIIERKLKGE